MMNSYARQTQRFITELIHLYRLIGQELKKIPFFRHLSSEWIQNISETIIGCNCIDRSVRRQNELRLFKETLSSIQDYTAKKISVKKSELTIKFSAVCEVLITRMREVLKISEVLKDSIVRQIEKTKHHFLKWSEGQKQKSYIPNKPKSIKETDQYVLKFSYTEATRSTVGNISNIVSPSVTPSTLDETNPLEMINSKKKQVLSLKQSKVIYSKATLPLSQQKKKRKTVTFQPQKTKSTSVIRSKTHKRTMVPPSLLQQSSKDASESSQNTDNQVVEVIQPKPRRRKNNRKNLTVQNQIGKASSNLDDEPQQIRDQYYFSQSKIMSKRTITDSASTLANKIKKRSEILQYNLKLQQQQQLADEGTHNDFVVESNTYRSNRSRINLTRKIIPSEPEICHSINSYRSIENGMELDLLDIALKTKIKRMPRKAKIQRISINNPSLQRIDSIRKQIDKRALPSPCIGNLGCGDIIIDGDNQEKVEEDKSCPNFNNFYNELNDFRNNLTEQTDPYLKNFSVFFRQQKKLSDEQSKEIQRILGQRKRQYDKQQFNIRCQITHKPPLVIEDFREQAYLMSLVSSLTECGGLYQGGPCDADM